MSATQTLTFRTKVHFERVEKGTLELRHGDEPAPPSSPRGRVSKLSRLMALAIRFDGMLERGEVKDYAELARLGHVSRARVTQIMNFLNLAPDIQEQILFLPEVESGRDPVKEWEVRGIASQLLWTTQRQRWRSRFLAVAQA
jgi:hypothetical protein